MIILPLLIEWAYNQEYDLTYSMDLRKRVVIEVEAGESIASVARRCSASRPTVRNWRKRS